MYPAQQLRGAPQTSCIVGIYQIEDACLVSEQRTVVQERTSQYFAVAVLPVRRRNHEARVTDLSIGHADQRLSTHQLRRRATLGHKIQKKWWEKRTCEDRPG